jgi:DNA polymerase II large subunit
LKDVISEDYQRYVQTLTSGLQELYALSEAARSKGLDPALKTECIIAQDIADLVEGLVGPPGVALSIRELGSRLQREEIAFKVAEEIVYGKFGHLEPEAAAEQAIRTALAIFTEGLTAAPIQGVASVKIKTNQDRSKYLAIYFAGPIRSAGGTDQALTLVVGDFVRRLLGLDRYKPMDDEVSRFIEELRLYERSVGRFQYHIPDEELKKALDLLPVEVTGTESDPVEVSSFRNLQRVETNRVRGGALRVVNDGIVGRSLKVLVIIEKLGFQGWDWLREFRKKSEKKSAGFMDDVIAGRPIFAFPSKRGGFRLRYGRSRNTGLSAVGIHPATMLVLENFLAAGTQMRLELPGKGGVTVPVDSLEPPVVALNDGSVVRVSLENFDRVKGKVKKILFLGDILISYGDFLYTNKALLPSGYVEEWWIKDVERVLAQWFKGSVDEAASAAQVSAEKLRAILRDPLSIGFSAREAVLVSRGLGVPLYPRFAFFWSNLSSAADVKVLKDWLSTAQVSVEETSANIVGKFESSAAQVLRTIWAPFRVVDGNMVIEGDDAFALTVCVGHGTAREIAAMDETALGAVCRLSGIEVKDKAPSFVGARMGRPEKAKRREMKSLVHVLFPVGLAGGSHRDLMNAAKKGPTFVEFAKRKCTSCKAYTFKIQCPECGSETVGEKCCPRCGKQVKENGCSACRADGVGYQKQSVNFKEMVDTACESLNVPSPKLLRGVKGLVNEDKTPEILEKGLLRAKYDLSVYKDGTIRFDATNAPLTHIKPKEVGATVETLRSLGYTHDIYGKPLVDADQILELNIQDVVIPRKAAKYFVQIAGFMDDLLTKVYGLPSCYNVKSEDDLFGQLIMGLAPHTCVAILGRIVGFTDLNLVYAHPIWHSAKRRDCDGDEDTIMLALDTLLNFSRRFLPAQIGGIMDAPLLLIPFVTPREVQRQAHDFDVDGVYPLEFYQKSMQHAEARAVSPIMDLISHRLGTEAQFEGFNFTTPVSDINMGNAESSYKQFGSMVEKLHKQLELGEKIEAVDVRRVALKVLTTHFIKDIAGNMRAFSTQAFRCKQCNKYIVAAQDLVEKYDLPKYYSQRLELFKEEIASMFDNNKPKQACLADFS